MLSLALSVIDLLAAMFSGYGLMYLTLSFFSGYGMDLYIRLKLAEGMQPQPS